MCDEESRRVHAHNRSIATSSFAESLSWLQQELPLGQRAAPKRVLVEHYLRREHALLLLRQMPGVEASSANLHRHADFSASGGSSPTSRPSTRTCSNWSRDRNRAMLPRSEVVEKMFRKARLKRCFAHIVQQQGGGVDNTDDSHRPSVVASPSPSSPVPHSQDGEYATMLVEEESKQRDGGFPREFAELPRPRPIPNVFEASPSVERRAGIQPRPEQPPPHRDESASETERAQRRILLQRFFRAARRQDAARGDHRLDLGDAAAAAAAGGAPCFTVGGRSRVAEIEGQERRDMMDHDDMGEYQGVGPPRADLLRRILHAMRESVRERGADDAAAVPPPPYQDRFPQQPSPRSEQPSESPISPRENAPSPPPRRETSAAAASISEIELPVHQRQEVRVGNAYQAVFEALSRLLPPSAGEGVRRGDEDGGRVAGAGGGTTRAAAVRCGVQCREHIRALQQGIEVVRSGPCGGNIRSSLVLKAENMDGFNGVVLALHDFDVPTEGVADPGASGDDSASGRPCPSASALSSLPMFRVTRVRCLSDGDLGQSLRFVILADAGASACGGREKWNGEEEEEEEKEESRFRDVFGAVDGGHTAVAGAYPVEEGRATEAEEVAPFGVLRATTEEDFRALVLGVASVKSALVSTFSAGLDPNAGTRCRQQPSMVEPTGQSSLSPPTASDTAAARARAAASLPWQGARVCIAELAPSLTFLGAVRAVEAEARRAGSENGISLRQQNLLICT